MKKYIVLSFIIVFTILYGTTYSQNLGDFATRKASKIKTNTTNFNNMLSVSDTTVQAALESLDFWGMSTPKAESTYLRLDASNDPLTGSLTIDADLFVTGQIKGVSFNLIEKSSGYTMLITDDIIICDTSLGSFTISTPSVIPSTGKKLYIKNKGTSGNSVTVDGDGGQTIDDLITQIVTDESDMQIIFDGNNWWIM